MQGGINPARRFRKATIKDVAEKAGVSVATVSLHLSGRRECSAAVTQRIREAVESLHYTPAPALRSARHRSTGFIGASFAAPGDAYGNVIHSFSDRFWRGVYQEAIRLGYGLVMYPDTVRESADADAFLDGRIDGLILSAVYMTSGDFDPRPAKLSQAGLPTVILLAPDDSVPPNCFAVRADERDTVALASQYLWDLGHRRIAHLSGPMSRFSPSFAIVAQERHDFTQDFLRERGVYDPTLFQPGNSWFPERDDIAHAVQIWRSLDSPPTAAFCANDQLALALMREAEAVGWRVPQELSVVGVDNIMLGAEATPGLTTVDIPAEHMGQRAVHLLQKAMHLEDETGAESAEEPVERIHILPVTDLVLRQSVAPCC